MTELPFYLLVFLAILFFIPLRIPQPQPQSPDQNTANMRRGPNRLGRRRFFPPGLLQQTKQEPEIGEEEPEIPQYEPTLKEVLLLKEELQQKTRLPIELIESIIDLAEYWPHTFSTFNERKRVITGREEDESQFVMRSQPLGYVPSGSENPAQNIDYIKMHPLKADFPNYETPSKLEDQTQIITDEWKTTSYARGEHPCRKIVFKFKSHDQGRCPDMRNRDTYNESWTWFDVGKESLLAIKANSGEVMEDQNEVEEKQRDYVLKTIFHAMTEKILAHFSTQLTSRNGEKLTCILQTASPSLKDDATRSNSRDEHNIMFGKDFVHPLLPEQKNCIQRNRTAILDTQLHTVTWRYNDDIDPDSMEGKALEEKGRGRETGNGEFVRNLKIGDAVTVWGKARFGGWCNYIERVEVKVYWAV